MKPFDLEAALRGEKVVTRVGKEIEEFYCFTKKYGDFPISAVIKGKLYEFTLKGGYIIGNGNHEFDLFMAPTKKKGWINIYPKKMINSINNMPDIDKHIYESLDESIKYAKPLIDSVQIEIEWEE